ncbi:MAG: VPS10 domain-containing protein [Gemmatimonadaceae bacterium]
MSRLHRALPGALLVLAAVPLASSAQQRDTTRRATPPRSRGDATRQTGDTTLRTPGDSARGDSARSPYGGFRFRSIGPAMISGRISDLAVHPTDRKTWYIGVAAGGVWKTINAGTTWTPVFDGQASYAIGTVVIDSANPNVVWVGTGENNAQRAVAYGDGVYKSVDAGRTWQNMGLKESYHIGKIVIDPRNSDVVYVAAQGPLSTKGGDRGLFKTTDGGRSWRKILGGGTWAGASDLVMDPRNPDVLLATTWQRVRRTYGYIAGGPESAIWRSTDGGATWKKSQAGISLEGDLGRVGLAVSPVNPDVVYAIVEATGTGSGFYRSRDGGVSWQKMSGYSNIGLYYSEIFADPKDVDRVYAVDVRTMVTEDAGRTFHPVGERQKHVDNHAVWIDPADTDHLLIGCDGGLYETFDRGQTYKWFSNLPLGQFYRAEVDNQKPFYRVWGGTQDNNSLGGYSRTRAPSGITNADWTITAGGDGFVTRVDPTDPNIVYSESQHGNLQRFDLRTGESINIVPQPEPGEPGLRWYWDSPFIISPHDPKRLYFAAQRVYRSDDRGDSWTAVSPDLSRQIDRNRLRLMDRVWSVDAVARNTSSSFFGAVVALAESRKREGLLWIGTDDGTIQVSEDGGGSWRKAAAAPGVPDTTQVARLWPSSHDANVAYAAFDGHMLGDMKPYVYRTSDLGRSWTAIRGDLPRRGTVYAIIDDPKDPNLLYAGTEFGVFISRNGGGSWTQLKGGLPTIQVRDLAIHEGDDDLVLATFGRSFYVLDDLTALRGATAPVLARDAILPVERTPLYVPSNTMAGGVTGSAGALFYTAPNPPFGAVISYNLRSALRSRRQQRQAAERAAARRNQDVLPPAWDSLRVEDREEAPAMVFTITDAKGTVVRRLTGPTAAGVQRVVWDLRGAPPVAPRAAPAGDETDADERFGVRGPQGAFVMPGTYTVSMAKRVDGVTTPVGEPRQFEVYMLDGPLAVRTPAVAEFQAQVAQLQRAALGTSSFVNELWDRMQALKRAVEETPGADARLGAEVRGIEGQLRDIREQLSGDPTLSRRQEPTPPSLLGRLGAMTQGSRWLREPTRTQRRQYEIADAEFATVNARVRALVAGDLARVERGAEAAGVPWTPGRVPEWK